MAEKKTPPDDSPAGAPLYMVSFGDMMTILLTFFILLCSYSKERQAGFISDGVGSFKNVVNAMGLPGVLPGDKYPVDLGASRARYRPAGALNDQFLTDAEGRVTTTFLDLEGRVNRIENPEGGTKVFEYDLGDIPVMVATPGDPRNGVPLSKLDDGVKIDIAYGGSCTGGKRSDMDLYARVFADAEARGRRIAPGVECFIQFGSRRIREYAERMGYVELFERVGVTALEPSCGACINAGPGASRSSEQVTVSAQNRNFPGRSGPGSVYLASPLTVAASALAGHIVSAPE